MSVFADAIAGGLSTLLTSAGVSVTYSRGANTVTLTAVPGRTRQDMAQGDVIGRDYIIKTSALIISGSLTTPAIGDTITEVLNDVSTVFNVASVEADYSSGDQGPWRYRNVDHGHKYTRIHTVKNIPSTADAYGQDIPD